VAVAAGQDTELWVDVLHDFDSLSNEFETIDRILYPRDIAVFPDECGQHLAGDIEVRIGGKVVNDDWNIYCVRYRREMSDHLTFGECPEVGCDHRDRVRANALRVTAEADGFACRTRSSADDDRDTAVDMLDDIGGVLLAFLQVHVHELTGCAEHEQTMHAAVDQEIGMSPVGVTVDRAIVLEECDSWRENAAETCHLNLLAD
jgi:hypothetical protein